MRQNRTLSPGLSKDGWATAESNRRTGLASFGTFTAMVITGYGLQVITSEALLNAMVIVHVASGVVFSIAYVIHLFISLKISRSRSWEQVREVA